MTPTPDEVRITHFDTAMALIEAGSLRLLTDPVLDGPGAAFDEGPVHLERSVQRSTPIGLGVSTSSC